MYDSVSLFSLRQYPQSAVKHLKPADPQFCTVLCSLGYIALYEPSVFDSSTLRVPQQTETGWLGIVKAVVNGLLMRNQNPSAADEEEDSKEPEWQTMSAECQAKVCRR